MNERHSFESYKRTIILWGDKMDTLKFMLLTPFRSEELTITLLTHLFAQSITRCPLPLVFKVPDYMRDVL